METFLSEYFEIHGYFKYFLRDEYDETLFVPDLDNLSEFIKDKIMFPKKGSEEKKIWT